MIVVSREHLSEGTDLNSKNIVSDRNSGPGLLRLTNSGGTETFTPDINESIVGAHSIPTDNALHVRAAGVVLYLKNSTDNPVRPAFDLDGELIGTAEVSECPC